MLYGRLFDSVPMSPCECACVRVRVRVRAPMFIYMLNVVQWFSDVCFGVRANVSFRFDSNLFCFFSFFLLHLINFILMVSLVCAQRYTLGVHLNSKQCLRTLYNVRIYLTIARVFLSHIISHHACIIVGEAQSKAPSNNHNFKRNEEKKKKIP